MSRKYCSLCRARVRVSPNGTERIGRSGNKRIHRHKKDYTLVEEVDEGPDEYRYWHDVAHFPG